MNIKTIIRQLTRYPKVLIAIIVIAVILFLFGVISINMDDDGNLSAGLNEENNLLQSSGDSQNESDVQQNAEQFISVENYDGPLLKDVDYSKMDFFKDGYQIVTLEHSGDGDTADFILSGKQYKTRFLAIDTPEKHEDYREKEPWGEASSKLTYKLLNNAKQIILQSDPDSDELDKYGRLLAWIWVDGKLLNYMLVDASLAKVAYLYGDYIYTDDLIKTQDIRQSEGKKIWGEQDPDFDY